MEEILEGQYLCDLLEMGGGLGRGFIRGSAELRMKLAGLIWWNRGSDEYLQIASLLPWLECRIFYIFFVHVDFYGSLTPIDL